MIMKIQLKIKGFIQPFERQLALLELQALTAARPSAVDGDMKTASIFEVAGDFDPVLLGESLSYWRAISTNKAVLTRQIRAEATSIVAGNGMDVDVIRDKTRELVPGKLPNRRCLRYASHGLHEYRGKFFPQLVRALANIGGVPPGGVILDPMCGSGTTLVEAKALGQNAVGLDLNPLSVFIADVKCRALEFDPDNLIAAFERIKTLAIRRERKRGGQSWSSRFSDTDSRYLECWFAPECLEDMGHIMEILDGIKDTEFRDYFRACLSNILRRVSFQKENDLRIRKEYKEYQSGLLQHEFINFSLKSIKLLVSYLVEMSDLKMRSTHRAINGDARNLAKIAPELRESVDVIITSPPYATALPYLDTDRLSLIVLGLLPRDEHRRHDFEMIGNREITGRMRDAYWGSFTSQHAQIPEQTGDLIKRIRKLNSESSAGFRKKNLPSLLFKYFFDMKNVLMQSLSVLKPNSKMYLVIGNNRTTAGGEEIQIETGNHMIEIAKLVGFEHVNSIDMDMLISRDIFKANAMPSEKIISLRKPQ